MYACVLELKQISEISGYPFIKIHYPDADSELFRIAASCFEMSFVYSSSVGWYTDNTSRYILKFVLLNTKIL